MTYQPVQVKMTTSKNTKVTSVDEDVEKHTEPMHTLNGEAIMENSTNGLQKQRKTTL